MRVKIPSDLVDLVTAYSKRHELLHDLTAAWRQLGKAQVDEGSGRASVRSVPRSTKRPQPLQDRLSADDQRAILERSRLACFSSSSPWSTASAFAAWAGYCGSGELSGTAQPEHV